MKQVSQGAVRWIGGILALALHTMLAWISWRPPGRLPIGDEGLYLGAARQFLARGTFDLEPLWPPLYPVFLALGKMLGGGWWLVVAVQMVLLLWVAWVVRDLARWLVGEGMAADLAGFLVLLHPTLAAFCHYFWPELLHLAAMTTVFWLLVRGGRGRGAMLALGALLGVALASKAILGPLVPLVLLAVAYRPTPEGIANEPAGASSATAQTRTWHLFWSVRAGLQTGTWHLFRSVWARLRTRTWHLFRSVRARLRTRTWHLFRSVRAGLQTTTWHLAPVVWVALALVLTTVPWRVWNAQRTGTFVLSDSVAFNLALGLDNTSRREMVDPRAADALRRFRQGGTTFDERRQRQWREVGELVRREGPASLLRRQLGSQYFRLLHVDSNFVHQLPGGALAERGKGYRAVPPLLATVLRLYARGFHLALWALAWVGAVLLAHRRHPWLWAVALFVLYNLALFLALHVTTRYRLQLVPCLALYAAGALAWWQTRHWAPHGSNGDAMPSPDGTDSFVQPTGKTWVLVGVGWLLLSWLALG